MAFPKTTPETRPSTTLSPKQPEILIKRKPLYLNPNPTSNALCPIFEPLSEVTRDRVKCLECKAPIY